MDRGVSEQLASASLISAEANGTYAGHPVKSLGDMPVIDRVR